MDLLKEWNVSNCTLVRTGVETGHIDPSRLPLKDEMTLLMASAPWEEGQFRTKGVDLLLEALANDRRLKLMLLWRGILMPSLLRRVARWGVDEQVTIVNEHVDINEYLKRIHAVVLLVAQPNLVKAYPHSLVESLAAGKPIITSRMIPMADFVEAHKVGTVIDTLSLPSLQEGLDDLFGHYEARVAAVRSTYAQEFAPPKMLQAMAKVYADYGVKTKVAGKPRSQ